MPTPTTGPMPLTLPLNVTELVLALVPRVIPNGTPLLSSLHVLPPHTIPSAFARVLLDSFDSESISVNLIHEGLNRLFANPKSIEYSKRAINGLKRALQLNVGSCGGKMLEIICGSGNIELLQYFLALPGLGIRNNTSIFIDGLDMACRLGQLQLIQWWASNGLKVGDTLACSSCFVSAATAGHIHVLQWWHSQLPRISFLDLPYSMLIQQLVELGQSDVLHWLEANRPDVISYRKEYWQSASKRGHVQVLAFFVEQDVPFPDSIMACIDSAAGNGHVCVLDFWYRLAVRGTIDCFEYSAAAMDSASAAGHLGVLEFFAGSALELRFTPAAMQLARRHGHWQVVDWWDKCRLYKTLLSGHLRPLPNGAPERSTPTKDLVTLCAFGRSDLLDDDLAEAVFGASQSLRSQALAAAFRFGQLEVITECQNYDWSYFNDDDDSSANVFLAAAMDGNQPSALQWLFHNMPAKAEKYTWLEHQKGALELGYIDLLEVLTSAVGDGVWNWKRDLGCLAEAASRGGMTCSLDHLNRMHSIRLWDAKAQRLAVWAAASKGHVHVLEWLLQQGIDFDITTRMDEAGLGPIDQASANGHATVLRWWAANALPFRFTELALWNAVKNKHKAVVYWWVHSGMVKGPFSLQYLRDAIKELRP